MNRVKNKQKAGYDIQNPISQLERLPVFGQKKIMRSKRWRARYEISLARSRLPPRPPLPPSLSPLPPYFIHVSISGEKKRPLRDKGLD